MAGKKLCPLLLTLPRHSPEVAGIPQSIFLFLKGNFVKIHAANEGVSGKVSSGKTEAKKWSLETGKQLLINVSIHVTSGVVLSAEKIFRIFY